MKEYIISGMMGPKESVELKIIAAEVTSEQPGVRVIIIDLNDAEAFIWTQKAIETDTKLPYLEALARYHAGEYDETVIADDIFMQLSFLRTAFCEKTQI